MVAFNARTAIASLFACAVLFMVAVPSKNTLGHGLSTRASPVACGVAPRSVMVMAHKKGSGSTENGRDSNSKRLGLKVTHGKVVPEGSIIFRQRGQTVHPGKNVRVGKDYTLYAAKEGVVQFSNGAVNRGAKHKRIRKIAHIIPVEAVENVESA
eukprot:CAMPEP_0167760872 /NCGR_PEP_ID=MMETSP0110_2-20121227/11836_1 /TAXON_ID=629695 /ORGANISM="Gymnochlora sp., Strain CCMP2014" /LENGTH=153 /DNA_ID=CAMNT_0007647449 /DNA_START=20 /DNA_END=481 /DNA_ORIENTATION=-